ncbi:unnamed protein product, partial [Didymodactylos carnosus]
GQTPYDMRLKVSSEAGGIQHLPSMTLRSRFSRTFNRVLKRTNLNNNSITINGRKRMEIPLPSAVYQHDEFKCLVVSAIMEDMTAFYTNFYSNFDYMKQVLTLTDNEQKSSLNWQYLETIHDYLSHA